MANKSTSWVARGNKDFVLVAKGLGLYISQAHPLMGNTKSMLGLCGFEDGECSKSSQVNCGPSSKSNNIPLPLCPCSSSIEKNGVSFVLHLESSVILPLIPNLLVEALMAPEAPSSSEICA